DLTVPEPYNQTAPAVFTLTLDKPAPQDLTFSYKTEDGRATEGADYQKAQGQVSIPKGGTSALIPTTVIGDTLAEPTENFFLQISKGQGATLQKAKGEAKILDAGPGISVGDVSVTEGNSGTTPAVFTVVANSAPLQRASVRFTTHQGTAKPSDDYLEQLEQITFEPGQVAKTVTVQVKGDTTPEQDEDFSATLSDPKASGLLRPTGKGTIKNDDAPLDEPPLPHLPALAVAPAPLPPPAPIPGVQAQPGTQANTQSQGQNQSQPQQQQGAQLAPGAMMDRQKQAQVERAHLTGKDAFLATERQAIPIVAKLLGWMAAMMAFGLAFAYAKPLKAKDPEPLRGRRRRI
ncbi:MAG: Calx-beta domain-containing protein, partial [Actinomycetota bacterium]